MTVVCGETVFGTTTATVSTAASASANGAATAGDVAFGTTTATVKAGANERPDGTKGPVEEVSHWRCGYCPHVKTCWDGFGVVPLTSGPKWRKAVSADSQVKG